MLFQVVKIPPPMVQKLYCKRYLSIQDEDGEVDRNDEDEVRRFCKGRREGVQVKNKTIVMIAIDDCDGNGGDVIFCNWRLPSEDRQCQKPMGGSSGGEQGALWGVVVLTLCFPYNGEQTDLDDNGHA